jgi:MFS transporter, DHA2 family, multidrug resistance protein
MGAGLPLMFVTLSTTSLSTVRREDMTAATSLYTVARRVGGNLGYALVATLVERFAVIHRAHLSTHITNLNSAYSSYYATLVARLARQTGDAVAAQGKALALVDSLVHRQAAILAYNDLAWLFGIMFLATLPLLFFLPRRPRAQVASKPSQH